MFGDGRVLRGPLPATGPGAVVEQEVTVRDTAPFFDSGVVEVADVAASVSVHHVRIVLEAPTATSLRYVTRLLPANRPRDETLAGGTNGPGDGPTGSPPGNAAAPAAAAGAGEPANLWRRLTFEYPDLTAGDAAEPGLPPEVPRSPYPALSTGPPCPAIA